MNLHMPKMEAAPAARRVSPARLQLSGIVRRFDSGGAPVDVLKGVSLDIAPGEFVAIMGQSGSGKSTLMNILGCLDRPTSGQYRVGGRDVATLSPDALADLRRDTFGFIFQSYHLIAGSSAVENVELPGIYSGMAAEARAARAEGLLCLLYTSPSPRD